MSASLKSAVTGVPAVKLSDMKPKEQVAYLLDQKKGEIAKMLPAHLNAERLLKVAQIAVTTTPGLLKCDVASLIGAIGQCAQMGLEPNTVLGHAYLVPFKVKRKDQHGNERWVDSVQVIVGYKGFIDLARRSGQIVSIAAHEVCTNDEFELVYGLDERLTHKPALDDRGDIVGFYAVAKLVGGGHAFEFMSLRQVEAIMLGTQSKGKYGPWKDHFIEMGRKSVVRRLAKYLPLSIEFQTAAALDGLAEAGKDQHLDAFDGEYSIIGPVEHIDEETGEITTVEAVEEKPEPEKPEVRPPERPAKKPPEKDPTMAVADEWKME
jgi:recombination protein RecT